MTHIRSLLAALALAGSAASAHAALAINEATYPGAGGDYNNLLNPPLPAAVIFNLEGGTNTFAGTIRTPQDAGDTFLVQLDPTETLTRIRFTFATNAQDINPVAITQNTQLVFDLASSAEPQPIVRLQVPDSRGSIEGPVVFQSALLSLMGGLYNTTVFSELLALNDAGAVGYSVAFDVTAPMPPIPEPSTGALLLAGLGLLGWAASRRKA